MMQDCASSNKIKENKYKILRMSLLLGSDENREETINNFEDSAREIDAMNDEIYLKDLDGKFYDTSSLEEEEKKLSVLVDYIGGRVEQRISLLTDFSNVAGFDLQNLPPIQYYDKLDDYKDRLGYIREYLGNISRLETLNHEIDNASEELDKAYKNKATFEEFNLRNEDIAFSKFNHIVQSLDYFKEINEQNVDEYLASVVDSVNESKKSLDIFTKSFTTLAGSGISSEEEEEYRSYVINAQEVYYVNKEKEYFIRLYQYLIYKESDYNSILVKRDCINNLLYERLELRKELNVVSPDLLSGIYELFESQYDDIRKQKDNINKIEELNDIIRLKKNEINDLELDNQKVEILALLREYGIIDTYSNVNRTDELEVQSTDTMDISNENLESSDTQVGQAEVSLDSFSQEDNILSDETNSDVSDVKVDYLDNQVVSVENVELIDLDLVHSKANKVMQRVGEMLGIKPKNDVVNVVSDEVKVDNTGDVVATSQEVVSNNSVSNVEEPINPMFQDTSDSTTNDTDISLGDNFWFPSDTPDALNELPDLDNQQSLDSNNFFANNSVSDLNFPDLKVDFGNNEEGVQE